MTNLLLLTKAAFLNGFQVNRKKNNQKSTFKSLGLFALLFFAISFIYNTALLLGVSEESELSIDLNGLLILVLVIGTALTFIISFYQTESVIFEAKDYEFLESLPIKKSEIVASKIIALYLMNVVEDAIIVLPQIILQLFLFGNYYPCLLAFISIFFISLIPLVVSSLLGALVAYIKSKSKHRDAVSNIIYIGTFLIVFSLSFAISSIAGGDDMSFISNISSSLPYFKLLYMGMEINTFYYFFLFILIHLLSFVIAILFISKVYRRINTNLLKGESKIAYKSEKDEYLPIQKAIDKKERQLIFKKSKYLLNSFLGPIIWLFTSTFQLSLHLFNDLGFESTADFNSYIMVMVSVCVAMGVLMSSLSTSTAASISIEGNNFESLLSYPVSPKMVIKSKLKIGILYSMVLNLIIGTIVSIITIVVGGFNIINVLAILILPSLASTNIAIIGMLCGLKWPKLKYENEMVLFKNSACTNFTMLFTSISSVPSFILIMVFGILGVIFESITFSVLSLVIPLVLLTISLVVSYSLLKKHGENLYLKVIER